MSTTETEDYYAREACHSGMIVNYWKTNAQAARQLQLEERVATKAMDFGNLVHTMVLEPKDLWKRYIEKPDFGNLRTNAAKAKRDAWLEKNRDKIAMTTDEIVAAEAMTESIWAHPTATRYLAGCREYEKEFYWTDESTGVACKAKLDGIADKYLLDLKTAANSMSGLGGAHPKNIKKVVADRGYFIQGAFYREAAFQADMMMRDVILIFVEKEPPYGVSVGKIDMEYLNRGMIICQELLGVYQEAIVTDDWPGYIEDVVDITAPRWLVD